MVAFRCAIFFLGKSYPVHFIRKQSTLQAHKNVMFILLHECQLFSGIPDTGRRFSRLDPFVSGRGSSRRTLAVLSAVAQAAHADHHRPGEQDGEDRLGLDGPWRLLQSSGHGVIATA